jgi:hypothetical protein
MEPEGLITMFTRARHLSHPEPNESNPHPQTLFP